jgi:hypothetical protein
MYYSTIKLCFDTLVLLSAFRTREVRQPTRNLLLRAPAQMG